MFKSIDKVKLKNTYDNSLETLDMLSIFKDNTDTKFSEIIELILIDSLNRCAFALKSNYIILTNEVSTNIITYYSIYIYLNKFFKITYFLFIVYIVFFVSNLYSYIRELINVNIFSKLSILNESEKETGPADDFFGLVLLFVLTLFLFIFSSFFFFLFYGKIFIWAFTSLTILMILILSIPLNLFFDFGVSYLSYIRGSASGNNFLKELLFDLISTFTIFIRFIIQNIRFLFIFSAIFELLEWIFSTNSSIFLKYNSDCHNLIVNLNNISYVFNTSNISLLLVNFIMFIVMYFYYTLHLLFLLLVQIVIYIGISSWLFFFLYSTRFLNKNEKFLLYKKLLN